LTVSEPGQLDEDDVRVLGILELQELERAAESPVSRGVERHQHELGPGVWRPTASSSGKP
jgi:hypothetical protein